MAATETSLHYEPDPIVEVLRLFYHRGLAILAQEQTEQQAADDSTLAGASSAAGGTSAPVADVQ